jgi:hypothetical protein
VIFLQDTKNPPLTLITQKVIAENLKDVKNHRLFQIAEEAVEKGKWVLYMNISYWSPKILEELEQETANTLGFIQTVTEADKKPREGLLLFKSKKHCSLSLKKQKWSNY